MEKSPTGPGMLRRGKDENIRKTLKSSERGGGDKGASVWGERKTRSTLKESANEGEGFCGGISAPKKSSLKGFVSVAKVHKNEGGLVRDRKETSL